MKRKKERTAGGCVKGSTVQQLDSCCSLLDAKSCEQIYLKTLDKDMGANQPVLHFSDAA